jgi:hypothetical protein
MNAKGTTPQKSIEQLAVRTIGAVLDQGEPAERRVRFSDLAADMIELKLRIGRLHEGKIRFCPPNFNDPDWRPAGLGKCPDVPLSTPGFGGVPIPVPLSPIKRAALSTSSLWPSLKFRSLRIDCFSALAA